MNLFVTLIQKLPIFLLASILSFATASEIDTLLNDFSKKNDTSQKTIDENKGHLVLYTREKIEKMRARTLKDILLTTPFIHYNENRYAIPDPLAGSSASPFVSNFVRIYIDGVEITNGWFGSGILLYGDINLDFADHIECYYGTPSFENSAEPSYMTIFIYSKDPSQDAGGKVSLLMGDNGANTQTFSYGEETEKFSYMVNISHTDAKRDKIDNGTATPLSRDYTRTQIFGYIKNENQIAHIQLIAKEAQSLAGLSWDATPEVSEMDYTNLHLDYGIQIDAQWHAQFSYDRSTVDIRQEDDLPLMLVGTLTGITDFNVEISTSTLTEEITYKKQWGDHHILAGIKARQKELLSYKLAGSPSITPDFNKESILSLFTQDQYKLGGDHLLSFGVSYNHIARNGGVEDSDLWHLRLGHIYASEQWSYKTYLYKIMFAKDPTALSITPPPGNELPIQTSWGLTHEISYTDDTQHARLLLMGMKEEDGLLTPPGMPVSDVTYLTGMLDYSYNFDAENRIDLHLRYGKYYDELDLYNYEDWGGYFALNNSFGNFELYNSLVWHKNTIDHINYFDLTSAITWNASKNLSFTLKGENLLDRAIEDKLYRFIPTPGGITPLSPLDVPVTDRRITLQMEYTF